MTWVCERCRSVGGAKRYRSDRQAALFAAAFDGEDRDDLGRRARLLGLPPLRVLHRLRNRGVSPLRRVQPNVAPG